MHRLAIVLTTLALSAQAPFDPTQDPEARRTDWWPRIEKIDKMLTKSKWKSAEKEAGRVVEQVKEKAWYGHDLDQVLAELALRQAIAEINLGNEHEARWHWYTALTLQPDISGRDLTSLGNADGLGNFPTRRLGEIPEPFERLDDVQITRLEPAWYPELLRPDLVLNSAAVMGRHPAITIEVILDYEGRHHMPVLDTPDAHPLLVYASFEWVSELPEPTPARLDGRSVDSLQRLIVSFDVRRDTGGLYWTRPDGGR